MVNAKTTGNNGSFAARFQSRHAMVTCAGGVGGWQKKEAGNHVGFPATALIAELSWLLFGKCS